MSENLMQITQNVIDAMRECTVWESIGVLEIAKAAILKAYEVPK